MCTCLNASWLAALTPGPITAPLGGAGGGAAAPEVYVLGLPLLVLGGVAVYCLTRLLASQQREERMLATLAAERRAADQAAAEFSRNQFAAEQAFREQQGANEKQVRQARALLAEAVVTLQRLKQE